MCHRPALVRRRAAENIRSPLNLDDKSTGQKVTISKSNTDRDPNPKF